MNSTKQRLWWAVATSIFILIVGWSSFTLAAPKFDGCYIKTIDGEYIELSATRAYETLVDDADTTFDDFMRGKIPKYYYTTDLSNAVQIKAADFDGIEIKGRYEFKYISINSLEKMVADGQKHSLVFNKGPAEERTAFYVAAGNVPLRQKSTGVDSYYYLPRDELSPGYYVAWIGETFWMFRIRREGFSESERLSRKLIAAASKGDVDQVSELLAAGADAGFIAPGRGDSFGWGYTALVGAIRAGHADVVKRLLRAGADANGRGSYGSSVLDEALRSHNTKIVDLLLEAGAALSPEPATLVAAASGGYGDIVKRLLEQGADVNAQAGYKGSSTPLSAAAYGGHSELVKIFIEQGARLNVSNSFCMTPLGYAIREGHIDAVKLLLKAGADTGKPDDCNLAATALEISNKAGRRDIAEIVSRAIAKREIRKTNTNQQAMSAYKSALRKRLASHYLYPVVARTKREEGTIEMHIIVGRSGSVVSSAIRQSSGHDSLDRAAERMLEDAKPFPALMTWFEPIIRSVHTDRGVARASRFVGFSV